MKSRFINYEKKIKWDLRSSWFIMLIVSFMIFLFSFIIEDISAIAFAIMVLFISSFIFFYKSIEDNLVVVLFLVCNFVFCIGSFFVSFILGDQYLAGEFDDVILKHILCVVYLGSGAMVLGFYFAKAETSTMGKGDWHKQETNYIRYFSGWILIIVFIARLIYAYAESSKQIQFGYVESYLGGGYSLPGIILSLSGLYELFLWIYLSTNPPKKNTMFCLLANIVVAAIQSMGGHRSYIVLNTVITLCYLKYRETIKTDNNTWFRKSWINLTIAALPLILFIFTVFTYLRVGLNPKMNPFEILYSAFETSSARIIGYEKVYETSIPKGNYTFGVMYTVMIRNSALMSRLAGVSALYNHTQDMALYGHVFGQTITYLHTPSVFLRGGGLGTSCFAELFHDYSYAGVILFSGLIGAVIKYLYTYQGNNVYIRAYCFMMLKTIFMVIRDSPLSFIYSNITVTRILVTLLFVLWIKIYSFSRRH